MINKKLDYNKIDAVKMQVAIKAIKNHFEGFIEPYETEEGTQYRITDKRHLRIPAEVALDTIRLADEMLTIINADNDCYIDSKYKLHFISKMHPNHFTNVQQKMYKNGKYIPYKLRKIKIGGDYGSS